MRIIYRIYIYGLRCLQTQRDIIKTNFCSFFMYLYFWRVCTVPTSFFFFSSLSHSFIQAYASTLRYTHTHLKLIIFHALSILSLSLSVSLFFSLIFLSFFFSFSNIPTFFTLSRTLIFSFL